MQFEEFENVAKKFHLECERGEQGQLSFWPIVKNFIRELKLSVNASEIRSCLRSLANDSGIDTILEMVRDVVLASFVKITAILILDGFINEWKN